MTYFQADLFSRDVLLIDDRLNSFLFYLLDFRAINIKRILGKFKIVINIFDSV
jgi:hypothetical protein